MSTIIDELVLQLTLDGTFARNEADRIKRETEKGARDAGKEIEKAGEQAKKAGDKAKEAGEKAKQGAQEAKSSWAGFADGIKGKLLGMAGAFTAIFSISEAFSTYLSTADELGKFSDSIGENIEDIHAWGEAVTRSGGTAEGFRNSVKSLSTQLSKMSTTGKSRAGKILESVGIDAGSIGRARKSLDVMLEISDVMQGMSKEEAMGFGQSLGLDTGTIMMLQQGREATADLIRRQKELGVFTKEDARVTAEFNDAMADLHQGFMKFASIIFQKITPALKIVTDKLKEFVVYLSNHQYAVLSFFTMLSTIIVAKLIPAFINLFKTVAKNPWTWVIAGIAMLALAIEDLIVWAEGGDAAFGEFWEACFGSKDEALQFFADVKEVANDFLGVVKDIVGAWKELKEAWNSFNLTGGNFAMLGTADGSVGFDFERQDALNEKFNAINAANMKMKPETQEDIQGFLDFQLSDSAYYDTLQDMSDKADEKGAEARDRFFDSFFAPVTDKVNNFLTTLNNEGLYEALTGGSSEARETVIADMTAEQEAITTTNDGLTMLTDGFIGVAEESGNTNTAVKGHFAQQQSSISQTGSFIDGLIGKFESLKETILSMPTYNPVYGASAGMAVYGGGGTISNNYGNRTSETRIGTINVNTQATDARGIASSIGGATTSRFNYMQANGGAY